jgi:hypothetical protein
MRKLGRASLIVGLTMLAAACAPAPKPVVVAPRPVAPPPAPVIPPMPLPPGGAAVTMKIPAIGADGVRITPNRNLSREEYIWHLRSGLNVAALNCQGPVWGEIAQNYNRYLQVHKSRLAQTNKAVDAEYVKRYRGQNALRVRDTHSTDLYNLRQRCLSIVSARWPIWMRSSLIFIMRSRNIKSTSSSGMRVMARSRSHKPLPLQL